MVLNYIFWLNSLEIHPLILKLINKVLRKYKVGPRPSDPNFWRSIFKLLSWIIGKRKFDGIANKVIEKKIYIGSQSKAWFEVTRQRFITAWLIWLDVQAVNAIYICPTISQLFLPQPQDWRQGPYVTPPPYVLIIQTPLIDVILHTLAT